MDLISLVSFTCWLSHNWFNLLQATLTIGTLLFTGFAIRRNSFAQETQNLIDLTRAHREIWSMLFSNPDLQRVLDPNIDISKTTITENEKLLITMVIHHTLCAYEGLARNAIAPIEGMREDVRDFFSRPIPKYVWEGLKKYQNKEFVDFVDGSLEARLEMSNPKRPNWLLPPRRK
jgi:hypothetical protein